ncbi:glycoside hydrolase family 76 protein [Chitinophagaceae bacterium 26-R-25]|nr:glycoside hydrolase family 76 protein [Chitinophagaceae bacterium 26-R-25]
MKKTLFIATAASLCFIGCTKTYDYNFTANDGIARYDINWNAAADSSDAFLIKNYWNGSGYFNKDNANDVTFNYWPQAHALDVMVDAYTRTNDSKYSEYFAKWYDGVKQKNGNTFLNNFYDDMEWNALAMFRAYNATNDTKFKDAVAQLWTDIKGGWNDVQGGGIAWKKDQTYYKNTPANAPACILAARLYQKNSNADDLAWAKKIYSWLKANLRDPATGFVNDGINRNQDGGVDNWAFTYNQGTFIGAAIELYNITKDASYLNDAMRTADYALNNSSLTTADRLLHDEGQGDGGLFKGIFVRYFSQLITNPDLPKDTRDRYMNYLKYNAETMWFAGTNKTIGIFGTYWKTAPSSNADLTTELSGCMLAEQAAYLKKQGTF